MSSMSASKVFAVRCDLNTYHVPLYGTEEASGKQVEKLHIQALVALVLELDGRPDHTEVTLLNGKYRGPRLKSCGMAACLANEPNTVFAQVWPCGQRFRSPLGFMLKINKWEIQPDNNSLSTQVLKDALAAVNKRPILHKGGLMTEQTTIPTIGGIELGIVRLLYNRGGITSDDWEDFLAEAKGNFGYDKRKVENGLLRMKNKGFVIKHDTHHFSVAEFTACINGDPEQTVSYGSVGFVGRKAAGSAAPEGTNAGNGGDSPTPEGAPATSEAALTLTPDQMAEAALTVVAPYVDFLEKLRKAETEYNANAASLTNAQETVDRLRAALAEAEETVTSLTSAAGENLRNLQELWKQEENPTPEMAKAYQLYNLLKAIP